MKGLLLKDIYNSKPVLYACIFLMLFIIPFSFRFNPVFCIVVNMVLPLIAISFATILDLRWNFNKFAVTTPVSKNNIVLSKYIYICFFVIAAFIYSVVIQIIYNFIHPGNFENIIYYAVTACFSLILVSAALPYWFKRKYNVGVFMQLIFAFVSLVTPYIIIKFSSAIPFDIKVIIFIIVLPVSLILCVLSFLLSVKIMKNSEFA